MLIAFNKPFGVVSQFTPGSASRPTLADFGLPPRVYPIGRLDADTEGLLLLSDEGDLNAWLLHPRHGHERRYWAQVERIPEAPALEALTAGLMIQDRRTLPGRAWILEPQPDLPPRNPPIRFRKSVPTCWIALELIEGKNRQVRRMTAADRHPTMRLMRVHIGRYELSMLPAGAWKLLTPEERLLVFA